MVRSSDFFASLVQTPDGRWCFSGVLNGWPALSCLELQSITCKVANMFGQARIERKWQVGDQEAPQPPAGYPSVRATLRMAPYTARGWTPESPGQVWWFFARTTGKLCHGTDMIRDVEKNGCGDPSGEGKVPICTQIHLFSHRYARGKKPETNKDLLTYHSACLLEWDHGEFCTLVELATLNGVGGRKGKSNWMHDKLEERPRLYQTFPVGMVMPWNGALAEIRCVDIEAKNLDEFKAYVDQYVGPELRFLDPQWHHSGDVRLWNRSQADVQRYLINYMGRDRRYTELARNCQSFGCDFYSLMAGKKDIEPYTAPVRINYKNRSHLFLYEPDLYGQPKVPGQ